MNNTLNTIINCIVNLSIIDWALIVILFGFAIFGFVRGTAKMSVNFLWTITGVVLAGTFYQDLASLAFMHVKGASETEVLFTSFLIIFFITILFKIGLYKLLNIIANIHGPCPLNRFLALVIFYGIAAFTSWNLAESVGNITIVNDIITDDVLRFVIALIVIFSAVIIISLTLIKLLGIRVGIDRPCPLIVALQPLDDIFNARNVNHIFNNISGIFVGVAKGFVLLILLIIIINHNDYLFNLEIFQNTNGLLFYIQNIATDVQYVLSHYLTFINK